jgi:hypothetical protein
MEMGSDLDMGLGKVHHRQYNGQFNVPSMQKLMVNINRYTRYFVFVSIRRP